MSKSMWIDAVDSKPVTYDLVPRMSIEVAFWEKGKERPYWGHFDSQINGWLTSDQRGYSTFIEADKVEYFAYIDNPYK